MDKRSNIVSVVAHCHLNANTKVQGLCDYAAINPDVIPPLLGTNHGIVQLPCPEATFLGMKRWGMTYEQYDTEAYRAHCEQILMPTVITLKELIKGGVTVNRIIGVNGSPSCGVAFTCVGYSGGEIEELIKGAIAPEAHLAPRQGVFIEVLQKLLDKEGIGALIVGETE